ncbi:M2 family metallopeptidase, partial [candidate division KSB1 bacterium]|nr:M2 family metallopeptidase [candidate division KSB1 bacterium]
RLQLLRQAGAGTDPLLLRQIDILYHAYLPNQIDTTLLRQIVEKTSAVEQKFSTFRGEMNGKKMTNNEIGQILKKETNSTNRKSAWLAGKQVGALVAADVVELAQLRNAGAQKLGFANFHAMSIAVSEQNAEELDKIFADLEKLSTEPFIHLKTELDALLADAYGIRESELMPWHYHDLFFQESPMVYSIDLDSYYAEHNIVDLAKRFYAGIDMDVESILARSDLYERENKNPHAFCTDIDREGDVRILCNIENNERWMETLLHELGHAVHDKYNDPGLPFLLREPAAAFTTEAIAMFFGRLSCNADWMQRMLGLADSQRDEIAQAAGKHMQLKQLIFARWAMVMYHFEKQLYQDPAQDLNALWWQLVERFQMVRKPAGRDEPDWAAKIHVALYPAYYHNYMLGELFASQLHHYIVHTILKLNSDDGVSYTDRVEVGNYLKESVFRPGKSAPWSAMIENATGEPLTAAYFVQQFVNR